MPDVMPKSELQPARQDPMDLPFETMPPGKAYVPPYPKRHDRYKPGEAIGFWRFPLFMMRYIRNPIGVFSQLHYQATGWVSRFGNRSYILINDPDTIREVLVKKSDVFQFDPIRKRVLNQLTGESLLTVEGEDWKRARQIVAPIFNPRIVETLADIMAETCQREAKRIAAIEGTFLISQETAKLAYEILADTLFSGNLIGDVEQMREDMEIVLNTLGKVSVLDVLGAPAWLPRLGNVKSRKARHRFRASMKANIAHRRKQLAEQQHNDDDGQKDLLTMMLTARSEDGVTGLSDIEIEDNLLAFIGAGHETTARALSWALYILSQDQHWRAQLQEELAGVDLEALPPAEWHKNLPLTKAILEETMRLYPPVPLIVRMANADTEVNGEPRPKGTGCIIWTFITHRHETLWEEPDTFRPERFFGTARSNISRFAYLPFGAGPRICVGMSFAMQEAVIALACLVKAGDFSYDTERPPEPVMRITLKPDNDMPGRVTARDPMG